MKKKITSLLLSAVAIVGLLLTSCSKDETETPIVTSTVNLEMPLNVESASLVSANVSLTNVASGSSYKVGEFAASESGYTASLQVPEGSYNITVDGIIEYLLDGTTVRGNVKTTRNSVFIVASSPVVDIVLNLYNAKEGFVIEEIFFTGTLTPAGKQYNGDQYFRITNNSSGMLYADGLAIVESSFLTTAKYDYTPNIMSQAFTADAVYTIPGNGTDVPVEAGKSLIIALNAIDHLQANANSFSLANADFEFYDQSSVATVQDPDNTEVPNLDKWYCYTASTFGLHNRGFKTYAIAKMEVDKETFLRDYYYEPKYMLQVAAGSYERTVKAYKIPNAWIVDAVNLSVESSFEWILTAPSLDAGWTYCGKTDSDKSRYGKSVSRRVLEGGKLMDTNNSSNDFGAETVPSLLR